MIIGWAVVAVTLISAVVCLLFSHQQRRLKEVQIVDILDQMDALEKRYDRVPD